MLLVTQHNFFPFSHILCYDFKNHFFILQVDSFFPESAILCWISEQFLSESVVIIVCP